MSPHSPEDTSPPWVKALKRVAIVLLLLGGIPILVLTLLQSKLLYHPNTQHDFTPAQYNLPAEDIAFTSKDGTQLHGWWFPVANAKWTILFCHGNAGNISHRLWLAQMFAKQGWQSFFFDYRGYGKSHGSPTEQGTYDDAMAAWGVLRNTKHIPATQIIVYGKSMGGPIASYVAAHTQPAAIVVDSTFSSFQDVAKSHFPFLPIKWIARFSYDTASYLQKRTAPLLVIHSPTDQVVPYQLGQKCFQKAAKPKQFLTIQGDHNNNLLVSKDLYLKTLRQFFQSLLPQQKTNPPQTPAPNP
jgi:alpha-beta hydrolase superfamily lysophospholipase